MTEFLTIFAGVVTFVIGQIVIRFVIEPVQSFKATVGEISIALINHANIYFNPGVGKSEKLDAAPTELRLLASKLGAQGNLIPFYDKIAKYFNLPSRKAAFKAKSQLIQQNAKPDARTSRRLA